MTPRQAIALVSEYARHEAIKAGVDPDKDKPVKGEVAAKRFMM